MAHSNPKAKGNGFEREIYKILRDKFGEGNVKRTLGSGSTDEPGDILICDAIKQYHFSIDTKWYKKLTWHELESMFNKLEKEVDHKKYDGYDPLLIIKINGQRDIEVVHRDLASGFLIRYRFKDWLRWFH